MVAEVTGAGRQRSHEFLYWEFYERGGKRAVRFGKWKAVQLNLKGVGQQDGVELYDLSKDLGEENNIAEDHPDVAQRAREYFAAAHTPSEFWSFGAKKKRK
jgi:arylsulfatase A-like enzyme